MDSNIDMDSDTDTYIQKIADFKNRENRENHENRENRENREDDESIDNKDTHVTYDVENLNFNIHNNHSNNYDYTINLSNNDLDELVQVLFANHANRMPLMQRLSHDFNMPLNKTRVAKEFRLHNPLQQYIRDYSKRRTFSQRQRDRGLSQGHNITLKKLQSNSPDDVLKTITSLANI